MKDIIQIRIIEGKARFFLLPNVPKHPMFPSANQDTDRAWKRYEDEVLEYIEAFKLCEANAKEIDNPELIQSIAKDDTGHWWTIDGAIDFKMLGQLLKHNDTFKLPEGMKYELSKDICKGDGKGSCGCSLKDITTLNCKATGKVMIHLIPEKKVDNDDNTFIANFTNKKPHKERIKALRKKIKGSKKVDIEESQEEIWDNSLTEYNLCGETFIVDGMEVENFTPLEYKEFLKKYFILTRNK